MNASETIRSPGDPAAAEVAIPMAPGRRRLFVAAIYLAIFAQMYLTFAINTIAVSLAEALNGMALFSLIFTIGTIAQVVLTPLMGKAGELFTKSRCVVVGAVLLTVQHVMVMFAPNMVVLFVGRALGGVGCALLFTIGVGMFADLFPVNERAKYTGLYGSIMAVAGIAAPIVAGFIADHGDWRLVFSVSIVLGVVSVVIALVAAPKEERAASGATSVDGWGSLFVALAVICLVGLCSFGGVYFPWASPVTVLLAAGTVVFAVLFVRVERRMGMEAAIPMAVFGYRVFVLTVIACFLVTITLMVVSTYVPAFVQTVMGQGATVAGLSYSLPSIIGFFGCTAAGVFLAKTGRFKLVSATGIAAQAVLLFALSFMGEGTGALAFLLVMTIAYGIAKSVISFVFLSIVQAKMPPKLIAASTAVVMFVTTLAGALGVAIFGIVPAVIPDPAEAYAWIFRGAALLAAISVPLMLALPKDSKPQA